MPLRPLNTLALPRPAPQLKAQAQDNAPVVTLMSEKIIVTFNRVEDPNKWATEVWGHLTAAAAKHPQSTRLAIRAKFCTQHKPLYKLEDMFSSAMQRGKALVNIRSLSLHLEYEGRQGLKLSPQLGLDISRVIPNLEHISLIGSGWARYRPDQAQTAHEAFKALESGLPCLERLELAEQLYPPRLAAEELSAAAQLPAVTSFALHAAATACSGNAYYSFPSFFGNGDGDDSVLLLPSLKELTVQGGSIVFTLGNSMPGQLDRLRLRDVLMPYRGRSQSYRNGDHCQCKVDLDCNPRAGLTTIAGGDCHVDVLSAIAEFRSRTAEAADVKQRLVVARVTHTTQLGNAFISSSRRQNLRRPDGTEVLPAGLTEFSQHHAIVIKSAVMTGSPPGCFVTKLLGLSAEPVEELQVEVRDRQDALASVMDALAAMPPESLPAKVAITAIREPPHGANLDPATALEDWDGYEALKNAVEFRIERK